MSITLSMMVKNESSVIERCLHFALPIIDSYYIIDTGSDDDTAEKARDILCAVPGVLTSSPWVSFDANRTELVRKASSYALEMHGDDGTSEQWMLCLDADMIVGVDREILRSGPVSDAAMIEIRYGNISYRLPQLLRARMPWVYRGEVHEYLDCEQPHTRSNFNGLWIEHPVDASSRRPERTQDISQLEEAAHRGDERAMFYLAQTHRDLGNTPEAAYWYGLRSKRGGFEEEAWYAQWQHGRLLTDVDADHSVQTLLAAYERRPWRAEPLHTLAWMHRLRGNMSTALMFSEKAMSLPLPQDEILFVHRDVYGSLCLYEAGLAAAHVDSPKGQAYLGDLLKYEDLPENIREYAQSELDRLNGRAA